MIDSLLRLARSLYRFRLVFLVLAGLTLLVFTLSLLGLAGLTADQHLVPALVAFCWSITLLSFAGLFAHVPEKPDRSAGWRRRFSVRVQRLFLGTLGLLVAGLSLALIVLSWQLLRTWLSA